MVELPLLMDQMHTPETALQEVRELSGSTIARAGRLLIDGLKAEDHLGSGSERHVFKYAGDRVVAFMPKVKELPPEDIAPAMKSYYYANKLAHCLLPDAIPRAHLAGSDPPLMVMERVKDATEDIDYHERQAFRRLLQLMGLEDAIDIAQGNLLKTPGGRLVYVDIVTPEKLVYNTDFNDYVDGLEPGQKAEVRRLQGRILKNLA